MFEEHENRVYRIAYGYLNNEEDAKDITQEVFLKVYLCIDLFRNKEQKEIISLLVVCTRNHCIDLFRKQERRLKPSSLTYEEDDSDIREYDVPSPDFTPEEALLNREMWERVAGYVDALPQGQRDAILLKFQYNLKDKDIGRLLKIKESAVSSRLNRARENLRGMVAADKD